MGQGEGKGREVEPITLPSFADLIRESMNTTKSSIEIPDPRSVFMDLRVKPEDDERGC